MQTQFQTGKIDYTVYGKYTQKEILRAIAELFHQAGVAIYESADHPDYFCPNSFTIVRKEGERDIQFTLILDEKRKDADSG